MSGKKGIRKNIDSDLRDSISDNLGVSLKETSTGKTFGNVISEENKNERKDYSLNDSEMKDDIADEPYQAFSVSDVFDLGISFTAETVMAMGDVLADCGIILSEEECRSIAEVRNQALNEYERVEIGSGATAKIIEKFSSSSYVNSSNFARTVEELIDGFYRIKTETDDVIDDSTLIDAMYDAFENKCCGDVDILFGMYMDEFVRRYLLTERQKKRKKSRHSETEASHLDFD